MAFNGDDDWRDKEEEARILERNKGLDEEGLDPSMISVATINSDFERDMLQPVTYYRTRQYYLAAKGFLELVDKYPQEGMLYYYLGMSFVPMFGGEEYAQEFFLKALSIHDYLEIRIDYAMAIRKQGKIERAIDVLEYARSLFPNDGTVSSILYDIYRNANEDYFWDKIQIVKSEAERKERMKYNELIREWETDHQILKPVIKDVDDYV